jgi:hypothetical protein
MSVACLMRELFLTKCGRHIFRDPLLQSELHLITKVARVFEPVRSHERWGLLAPVTVKWNVRGCAENGAECVVDREGVPDFLVPIRTLYGSSLDRIFTPGTVRHIDQVTNSVNLELQLIVPVGARNIEIIFLEFSDLIKRNREISTKIKGTSFMASAAGIFDANARSLENISRLNLKNTNNLDDSFKFINPLDFEDLNYENFGKVSCLTADNFTSHCQYRFGQSNRFFRIIAGRSRSINDMIKFHSVLGNQAGIGLPVVYYFSGKSKFRSILLEEIVGTKKLGSVAISEVRKSKN